MIDGDPISDPTCLRIRRRRRIVHDHPEIGPAVDGEGRIFGCLPVRSVTRDEASGVFDFPGALVGTDNPASSAITRQSLGWTAWETDLLTDIKANYLA